MSGLEGAFGEIRTMRWPPRLTWTEDGPMRRTWQTSLRLLKGITGSAGALEPSHECLFDYNVESLSILYYNKP